MNRNNSKRSIPAWLPVVCLILVAFIVVKFVNQHQKKSILSNLGFTNCSILNISKGWRAGYVMYYQFDVNGKSYYSKTVYGDIRQFNNELIGKRIPIIYKSDDPNIHSVLILPKDFETYDLSFPDSMRWILKYVKN